MTPAQVVAVVGTGTEVGKTWVSCELLRAARARGARVQARKPVQSFAVDDVTGDAGTDAGLLAAVTGEALHRVCPAHRWYARAMAPPMAADALGRPPFRAADLLRETNWSEPADLALVETVGGLRSPMTHDADSLGFVRALAPDAVVLVADAGLGTINAVRLAADALAGLRFSVLLNRFDEADELHHRNRAWLAERDGLAVFVDARAPALVGALR
jgi:dethiobiotin synthetase